MPETGLARHLFRLLVLWLLVACQARGNSSVPVGSGPTPTLLAAPSTARPRATMPPTATVSPAAFQVQVDVTRAVHPISPLIYGLGGSSPETLKALRPALLSWGGNPSTRYNWRHGHAWNAGRDWFYRNGNYGYTGASASDDFVEAAMGLGSSARLTVPTLGWVAKNDNNDTCSFPLPGGGCGDADGASCENPGPVADRRRANVASDETSIAAWMRHLIVDRGYAVPIVALDNEPELWGYTHYDVHPTCTTYDEILQKHLSYAAAIRAVAPEVELAGPNTCCWHFYWNSAAGAEDRALHGGAAFLPWFLDAVRAHDEASGMRTLDVLDVHYYPEGLYNDNVDDATAAHRLRSTRSLWDPGYVDESWIDSPVMLIPRLKRLLEEHYPGTRLGLGEWNWGAEGTLNGALAIADVLGIFGREALYYAAYWHEPPVGSPGFFAFKAYTNYDDQGGGFGDVSVWSQSDDSNVVSSYAALDSATGELHVMLVHKQPDHPIDIVLDPGSFEPAPPVRQYRLAGPEADRLAFTPLELDPDHPGVTLPPYSLTLLVLAPLPR